MLSPGISRTEPGFLFAADICIFGQKCKGRRVGIVLPARTSLCGIWDHDRPTLRDRYGDALVWPERDGSTECIPLTHGELAGVNRLGHCVTPVPARMRDLGTPHLYGIITAARFGVLGGIPAGGLATCGWDLPREGHWPCAGRSKDRRPSELCSPACRRAFRKGSPRKRPRWLAPSWQGDVYRQPGPSCCDASTAFTRKGLCTRKNAERAKASHRWDSDLPVVPVMSPARFVRSAGRIYPI